MSAPAPARQSTPPADDPPRDHGTDRDRYRRWLRWLLGLALVAAIFGKALPHLVDFREVGLLLAKVEAEELTLLTALTLASVLTSAMTLSVALPGLRVGTACAINMVTTALSYALPGGGAAGAALNVRMSRELGFRPQPIALQMLVTGIWNIGARLVLPVLALGLLGLASDVPPEVRGAAISGLVFVGVLAAVIAVLLCCERPASAATSALTRLGRRFSGRFSHRFSGRFSRRFSRQVQNGHGTTGDRVALFQAGARALIRTRWPALTLSTLGYHLSMFAILYLSLQAVGISRVGVMEAFAVYAVARQVTVIPLTPGSAGIVELALIGGLGLTGAELPAATAGVLLFRFFTYLLFLPAGGAVWLWWRIRRPVAAARPRAVVFHHPSDAIRLSAGVTVLGLLIAMSRGLPRFEADLFRVVNDLPGSLEVPIWGVMQAGWIGTAGLAALAALSARRTRLALDLALSGSAAWLAAKVVKDLAGRPRPAALIDEVLLRADAVPLGTGFVAGHTTVAAALATVAGAYLPRPYRRALWLVVAAVAVARVYVGAHLPLDVVGGAALGWAIGAAVLLLRGTPGHHLDHGLVRTALLGRGLAVTAVERIAGDLRRAVPFAVTTATGALFVKAVGRDQRDADRIHRLGRRWRHRPGEPPFATAKQQVEHEGYLLMRAARTGARVPRVRFITEATPGAWLLATDLVEGRPLSVITDLDDAALDELWRQLALLRPGRIAHRDLRAENILVDSGGRPWIVGWGAAEADTTFELVREDGAKLLALTSEITGPGRADAAAERALGTTEAAALASYLRGELAKLPPIEAEPKAARRPIRPRLRGRRRERRPSAPAHARHPGDVGRIIIGLGLGLGLSLFAAGGFLLPLEADVFRLVNDLPGWLFGPVNLVMQAGALGAVGVAAGGALVARRGRLAVDLALGGSLAWVLAKLVKGVADRGRPGGLLSEVVLRGASEGGLGFVSGHAAVAAALATVASAQVRRPVRWSLWAVVAAVALGRMYVGAHFPLDVVAGIGLGWAIGGAIHLVRGTPSHIPRAAQVAAGLQRCGVRRPEVSMVKADARGSVPFLARADGDRRIFVKALGRDQRDADLLFKAARFLLYRELEDEAPMASPKRQVEHEAYMLLRAADAGARVPGLVGVAAAGAGTWILAEEAVDGPGDLGTQARDLLNGPCLKALWGELGRLRAARIAHRDLRLANVLIDADGRPVLVDFGFAEDGASDQRLAHDVAELLVSTALVVGAPRAVAGAADALGPDILDGVNALLQPLALARSTRQRLHDHPGLLPALRYEVARSHGGPEAHPPLSRLPSRPWKLLLVILAGYVTYHGLIGITGVRHPAEVFDDAGLRWLLVAAVLVVASYAAGAVSLMGASPRRLALGRTYLHQVAASYASRQHQAGRGSDTVLTTYLRMHGARPHEALETVAVTRLTGGAVHVLALILAVIAAALEGWRACRLPGWAPLTLLMATVIAAAGFGPVWRRRAEITVPLRTALATLPQRLHRPGRLSALLLGNAALTSCSVLAFLAVAHATRVPLSPGMLAAVYLLVIPLRLLGPLPGGVGVVEPVLILVLAGLGTGPTEAVMTVLIFRVLSFWLPILPGILAFRRTGRQQQ